MWARLRVGYVGWTHSAMPPKCPAGLGALAVRRGTGMFARRTLWGRSAKRPRELVGSMVSLALRLGTPSAFVRFRISLRPACVNTRKRVIPFTLCFTV